LHRGIQPLPQQGRAGTRISSRHDPVFYRREKRFSATVLAFRFEPLSDLDLASSRSDGLPFYMNSWKGSGYGSYLFAVRFPHRIMVKNSTNSHFLAIRIVTFLHLWRTPPNPQLLTFSYCPYQKLARRFSVPHNEMGVGAGHEEILYSCAGNSRRTGRLGHRLCCGTCGPAASAKTRFTFRPRAIRDETSLNHSCARTIATTTKRRVN
jgi:hypothetical protein